MRLKEFVFYLRWNSERHCSFLDLEFSDRWIILDPCLCYQSIHSNIKMLHLFELIIGLSYGTTVITWDSTRKDIDWAKSLHIHAVYTNITYSRCAVSSNMAAWCSFLSQDISWMIFFVQEDFCEISSTQDMALISQ